MSARDRIISEANAIVLSAARKIDEAVKDVHLAAQLLERHPEFVRSGRKDPLPSADRVTLPTFRYASLLSVLEDINLGDAARTLRLDIRDDEKSMADMIADARAVDARRLAKAA